MRPLNLYKRSLILRFSFFIIIFCLTFFIYNFFHKSTPLPLEPPIVIVMTPTYKRLERLADITRLSQTLKHVKNLHWIVVEDGAETVPAVERILVRSGLPYVYLCTKTLPDASGWSILWMLQWLPDECFKGSEYTCFVKGGAQRNLGIQYIQKNYRDREAVVYFGDDDNSYDIRLFDDYIRKVKRIGVWAVGLAGEAFVEAPRVKGSRVVGWNVVYDPSREFAIDMAGFAVNLREIKRVGNVSFDEECVMRLKQGPEPCFLAQFGLAWDQLEPFGHDEEPRDILVWHTQTVKSVAEGGKHGYVIEDAEKVEDLDN